MTEEAGVAAVEPGEPQRGWRPARRRPVAATSVGPRQGRADEHGAHDDAAPAWMASSAGARADPPRRHAGDDHQRRQHERRRPRRPAPRRARCRRPVDDGGPRRRPRARRSRRRAGSAGEPRRRGAGGVTSSGRRCRRGRGGGSAPGTRCAGRRVPSAASSSCSTVAGDLEVGDVAAGRADEVVVVVGEVLGQLVAGELVGGHDAVDDAGPLEHGEVPVGGALGQARLALEELRDRQGLVDVDEQVHQRPALRRVALAVVPQPARRGGVEVVGHQWWGWSSRISVCSPTRSRCPP